MEKKRYKLVSAELTFYDGKKTEVEFYESKILDHPLKITEDLVLDVFKESGMINPPVKCKLNVKYL